MAAAAAVVQKKSTVKSRHEWRSNLPLVLLPRRRSTLSSWPDITFLGNKKLFTNRTEPHFYIHDGDSQSMNFRKPGTWKLRATTTTAQHSDLLWFDFDFDSIWINSILFYGGKVWMREWTGEATTLPLKQVSQQSANPRFWYSPGSVVTRFLNHRITSGSFVLDTMERCRREQRRQWNFLGNRSDFRPISSIVQGEKLKRNLKFHFGWAGAGMGSNIISIGIDWSLAISMISLVMNHEPDLNYPTGSDWNYYHPRNRQWVFDWSVSLMSSRQFTHLESEHKGVGQWTVEVDSNHFLELTWTWAWLWFWPIAHNTQLTITDDSSPMTRLNQWRKNWRTHNKNHSETINTNLIIIHYNILYNKVNSYSHSYSNSNNKRMIW